MLAGHGCGAIPYLLLRLLLASLRDKLLRLASPLLQMQCLLPRGLLCLCQRGISFRQSLQRMATYGAAMLLWN